MATPERLLLASGEAAVGGLGEVSLVRGPIRAARNGILARESLATLEPPTITVGPSNRTADRQPGGGGFHRSSRRFVAALAVADVLIGGVTVALVASFSNRISGLPLLVALLGVIGAVVWPLAVALSRGYTTSRIGIGSDEIRSVLRAGVAVVVAGAFLAGLFDQSALLKVVVVAVPTVLALSLVTRFVARKVLHKLQSRGMHLRKVIVVGSSGAAQQLKQRLDKEAHAGMQVIGVCVPREGFAEAMSLDVPVLGELSDVAAVVRKIPCDAVAVTTDDATRDQYLRELSWSLEGTNVEMLVDPGLVEVAGPRMHIRPLMGVPLLHIEQPHFTGWRRVVKRTFDVVVTGFGLLVISPLLAVIALAVKLQDGGPVIFKQTRIGRGGEDFTMLKFRSMVTDAEARKSDLMALNEGKGGLFKLSADPRITRLGKFLRDFSLDELPQLFNVLQGSMSLVGPRPHLAAELAQMPSQASRRALVTPGLTGLWQVSGRSDLEGDEAVRLDLRYVENWSLSMDLLILWKTAAAVLRRAGAR